MFQQGQVVQLTATGEQGRVLRDNGDGTVQVDFYEFDNSPEPCATVSASEIK